MENFCLRANNHDVIFLHLRIGIDKCALLTPERGYHKAFEQVVQEKMCTCCKNIWKTDGRTQSNHPQNSYISSHAQKSYASCSFCDMPARKQGGLALSSPYSKKKKM